MIPSRQTLANQLITILANKDTVIIFVSLPDIIAQITGMVYFLS